MEGPDPERRRRYHRRRCSVPILLRRYYVPLQHHRSCLVPVSVVLAAFASPSFSIQILHSIYFQSTDGHDLDQQEEPNFELDAGLEPLAASTIRSTVASHYTRARCSSSNRKNLKGSRFSIRSNLQSTD